MNAWIADSAWARSLDRRATDEFGVTTRSLMEAAGAAVFDALVEVLPNKGKVVVLCGKGNNGGDGFVAARLAHEFQYEVECLVAAKPGELRGVADEQRVLAQRAGLKCVFVGDSEYRLRLGALGEADVVVDALLGIGAKGEVVGAVREAIEAANASDKPVIAVDVPSGIECDTGRELGEAVWALRTVTFGQPKPFLFAAEGLEKCGYWSVAKIGFPPQLLEEPTGARLIDASWVAERLPERLRGSHKGHNGAVLVVAGSERMPGAAVLAALGALRAGAGYVGVASVPSVLAAVAAHVPEAVHLPLARPAEAGPILEEAGRWDAMVVGPGLGDGVDADLSRLFAGWTRPACLDADALNAIAQGVVPPSVPTVSTPHPGELGRLLGTDAAGIQADRFGRARAAADTLGRVVLLKGAHSIVASPGQPLLVNRTGNPGMAVAGMGDVLSGVVGTLLAQGLEPTEAAACAMYWHGLAGDLCAQIQGPIGFSAAEVAHALSKVRAKIAAACDNDSASF